MKVSKIAKAVFLGLFLLVAVGNVMASIKDMEPDPHEPVEVYDWEHDN